MPLRQFDVIVIGGGAAGLMCAIEAGKRGRSVAVIEHQKQIGRKILMSGGGRCNFTNIDVSPEQFVSANPHFCRSALSRYTSSDFISLVRKHGIPFHEKKLGQLFCDGVAREIIRMLTDEAQAAGVTLFLEHRVQKIAKTDRYLVQTSQGDFSSRSLVIATGGLSIPKVGATDFGHRVARQFGLNVIPPAPALDGFVFSEKMREMFAPLAGVSAPVVMTCNQVSFTENILFTHVGLSGPAALQTSLYWNPGDTVRLNLLPNERASDVLIRKKQDGSKAEVTNLLATIFPSRLADTMTKLWLDPKAPIDRILDADLRKFGDKINRWEWVPAGTVGYTKAEITRGGVDTNELSSQTMEAKKAPGLFFIGEVVDVTGWLGGYNFQWAWSSGWAAGQDA